MLIAKIENNTVVQVADYRNLFPNTSFGPNGPSDDFLANNDCMTVTVWKEYDATTHKLVPAEPHIEGDTVYTVQVVELSVEEIDAQKAAKKAAAKSRAESLLQATDWTEGKTVRDITRTPHLVNGDEFDDYRVALRAIAVNPPETEVTDWPVKPDEVWSTQ